MYNKTKNNTFLFVFLLIIIFLLYVLLRSVISLQTLSPHPNRLTDITAQYGNCKWETEDGSVIMWIDHDMVESYNMVEYAFGTINLGNESTPVYFRFGWTELDIIPITFFDGEKFEPEWDRAAPYYGVADWHTKYTYGSKQMKISIRKNNLEEVERNFALPDMWTLYLTEENLSKEEIQYPELCYPEYYNLYLQYEDIFNGEKVYTEIVSKYGVCDEYLPSDYDPNLSTFPAWGKYIIQGNELGGSIYYIAFNVLDNGKIHNAILVKSEPK